MKRPSEYEVKALELVKQAHPASISKGNILAALNTEPGIVHDAIERLLERNHVSSRDEAGFTHFYISDENVPIAVRSAICPKCNSTRTIYGNERVVVRCTSPTCLTPAGNRTINCA